MVPEVGISTAASSGSAGPGPSSSPGRCEQLRQLRVRHEQPAAAPGRPGPRARSESGAGPPPRGWRRGRRPRATGTRSAGRCARWRARGRPGRRPRAARPAAAAAIRSRACAYVYESSSKNSQGLSGTSATAASNSCGDCQVGIGDARKIRVRRGRRTRAPERGTGPGPTGPGPVAVSLGDRAGKLVEGLGHVVGGEVEAVRQELGERLVVLLPAILRASTQLAQRRAQLSAAHAQRGGQLAQRHRVLAGACGRGRGAPRRAPCARPSRRRRARRPAPARTPREAAGVSPFELVESRLHLVRVHVQRVGQPGGEARLVPLVELLERGGHLVGRDPERLGKGGGELVAAVAVLALVEGAERLRQLARRSTPSLPARSWNPGGCRTPRRRAGRRGGSRCPSPGRRPRWPCRRRPGFRAHSRPTRPQARLRRRSLWSFSSIACGQPCARYVGGP